MKKLILLLLFIPIVSYGQTFKEIEKFYDNGNKYIEVVKNSNLDIIQRNRFSKGGTLISTFNINPFTGEPDGEFIYNELSKDEVILKTAKGFLERGLLNCDKCTVKVDIKNTSDELVFTDFLNPKNDGIKFQGKFLNGKPVGNIKVFKYEKEYARAGVDAIGTRINARLGISEVKYFYASTGKMYINQIGELNYDENGYLDGEVERFDINEKLVFKNGILNEIYSLENKNKNIYRDSIVRNSKIWKVDGKYVKNYDGLNFSWNEFEDFEFFALNSEDLFENISQQPNEKVLVILGGYVGKQRNGLKKKITELEMSDFSSDDFQRIYISKANFTLENFIEKRDKINNNINLINNRKQGILDVIYYSYPLSVSYDDFHLDQINKIDPSFLEKAIAKENEKQLIYQNELQEYEKLVEVLNSSEIYYNDDFLSLFNRIKEIANSRNETEFYAMQKYNDSYDSL